MNCKRIGSTIYVHKSNIQELLDMLPDDEYKSEIIKWYEFRKQPGTASYEVIKYDIKQHKLSFIDSPDWDSANEPTVGESTCWNFDKGTSTYRNGGTTVYHSKELFVSDNYTEFDIEKAKERTKLWSSLVSKEDKKKIGNKKFWIQWCKEHGLEV